MPEPDLDLKPDSKPETENISEKFTVSRVSREGKTSLELKAARESPVTIILNDQELVTLLASPDNLDYLAVGFLSSEGLLQSKEELKSVIVDDVRGVVRVQSLIKKESAQDILFKRVITSGCGRGASFYSAADASSHKVNSDTKANVNEILDLVNRFQHSSQLYTSTHGVHSAAICDTKNILLLGEDIGRHNALDKIFGECLLKDIDTDGKLIITSGRVSSEILHKVAKKNIPILVSISAPTNLGVKIADMLNITLIASVKGGKMDVYTHDWRVY